jgi:hypothetical protein
MAADRSVLMRRRTFPRLAAALAMGLALALGAAEASADGFAFSVGYGHGWYRPYWGHPYWGHGYWGYPYWYRPYWPYWHYPRGWGWLDIDIFQPYYDAPPPVVVTPPPIVLQYQSVCQSGLWRYADGAVVSGVACLQPDGTWKMAP